MKEDFLKLAEQRISVRDYDPARLVPKETLLKILEAGRLAPSAANAQPWQFLLVSSQEMRQKIHPSYPKDWFIDAPHILIVSGNKDKAWRRRSDGYCALETDLTIAMDHMILAAESLGVSTCWIAAFDPEILRQALSLGPSEQVFAMTPLGYPRQAPPRPVVKNRRPLEQVASFL